MVTAIRPLAKRARHYRAKGLTYKEISEELGAGVPKSTLAFWCRGVKLPSFYSKKVLDLNVTNLARARSLAVAANKAKRNDYLNEISKRNRALLKYTQSKSIAKLLLAALYLGEGAKNNRGHFTFANSDPGIITFFLRLLRMVYTIDESRFRCTILCRADQNTGQLERFWSSVTRIPLKQFYGSRVDPRTVGKTTRKKNYKGVCRIDHFSANIYNEFLIVGGLLTKGL